MIAELAVVMHTTPDQIAALDERMAATLVDVLRRQYES